MTASRRDKRREFGERERSTETQEIVRLPAKKREVGQSQKPDSHMKWRFKNRKTFPGARDQMAWGWVYGSGEDEAQRKEGGDGGNSGSVEPGWREQGRRRARSPEE